MMTHALTNGHVSSEVVDVGLSEAQESRDVPVNGDGVAEQTMAEDPIQDTKWELDDIKATFEALLFVSHDPLTMEKLASVIEGVPKATLKITMQTLQGEYEQVVRGLQVTEVAGGFVVLTRPGAKVPSHPNHSPSLARPILRLLCRPTTWPISWPITAAISSSLLK